MNKMIVLLAVVLMSATGVFAQHAVKTASLSIAAPAPTMSLESNAFSFGVVPQGTPVSHTFEFTNEGSTPLQIESVKASCGCTATSYSKKAIAPGEKGFVTATYNAAKPGHFKKTVSVASNAAESMIVLTLRGQVQGDAN